MRRALATATLVGAVALVPATAATAFADDRTAPTTVLASSTGTDVDEPALEDGNDDSGKWGLVGLSGLFGLFGYKKYREHTAARTTGTQGTGTTGTGNTGNTGGGSSRRV